MAQVADQQITFNFVVFQQGSDWLAQCLQYDIAVHAKTLTDLRYEIERTLISHLAIAEELGIEPFSGLDAAPQKFWTTYEQSKLHLDTGDRQPFRLPHPSAVPSIYSELRIAEQIAS